MIILKITTRIIMINNNNSSSNNDNSNNNNKNNTSHDNVRQAMIEEHAMVYRNVQISC